MRGSAALARAVRSAYIEGAARAVEAGAEAEEDDAARGGRQGGGGRPRVSGVRRDGGMRHGERPGHLLVLRIAARTAGPGQ